MGMKLLLVVVSTGLQAPGAFQSPCGVAEAVLQHPDPGDSKRAISWG